MTDGLRVLTLDLETKANVADVWGLFNQNIAISQLHDPTRVICFAAKWLDSKPMIFRSEHHDGPSVMFEKAHALLEEADAVVTYNGDRFDLPHLNREFLEMGFKPPAPYKSIDLYKTIKRHFRFASNKLAHVTDRLALTGKLSHTGHQLWIDCMAGDEKAWGLMRRYNKQDVTTTEELYRLLLPWITNHPTVGLYMEPTDGTPQCPRCGGPALQKRGYTITSVSKFQRLQCQDCGAWSREGKRLEGVDVR